MTHPTSWSKQEKMGGLLRWNEKLALENEPKGEGR